MLWEWEEIKEDSFLHYNTNHGDCSIVASLSALSSLFKETLVVKTKVRLGEI